MPKGKLRRFLYKDDAKILHNRFLRMPHVYLELDLV
jgi:hypothetical protein